MAYGTSNPPICIVPRVGSGPALWMYVDGDAHATVEGAGYFSNGEALGMKVNDVVISVDTATPTAVLLHVASVDTTATCTAATLS